MTATDALRTALKDPLGIVVTDGELDTILGRLEVEGYYLAPVRPAGTTPAARTTDPQTSHRAAAAITLRAGTQRALLLQSFVRAGEGLTDEEAMERAVGVSPSSEYAKRCSELREAGWISPTGQTRKGNSGQDRIVSEITDAGQAAYRRAQS